MKNKISEIKVSYKSKTNINEAPKITSSKLSAAVFRENFDDGERELRESFKVMFLNRANKVKGIYNLSTGGVAGTVVDFKIIAGMALKTLSSSVILCHNHPSGNLKPSQSDIMITKRIILGLGLFDIALLDHIILGLDKEYFSFADEGMMIDFDRDEYVKKFESLF